jgi:hypothetical protein
MFRQAHKPRYRGAEQGNHDEQAEQALQKVLVGAVSDGQ